MAGPSSTELSRDLGPFAVFSTAAGTMIGAGIFALPGLAADIAGAASMISFALAGIISLCAAISVSELATGMPKAGGSYYFLSRTFGSGAGSVVGWGCYLGLVFKGAFAMFVFGEYLKVLIGGFIPTGYLDALPGAAPVMLVGIIGTVLLLVINYRGAKASGGTQNLIVIGLLSILGLFVVVGVFMADVQAHRGIMDEGFAPMLAATGLVFVSYLGIEKVSAMSEEVHNPGRNLPLGILSSVIIITVLYVSVMFIIIGVDPLTDVQLVGSETAVSDAAEAFLPYGGVMLAIAGLLAMLSTGNAAILASSRYPFAMGRDNLMANWITKIHQRFQTPGRAIIMTAVIMIVLIVTTPVETMAYMAGVFNIFIFALINLAVIMLRTANPDWFNPEFRSPLFPWIQIFGIVGALSLITQMGTVPQIGAVVFLAWGIGWAWLYRDVDTEPKFNFFDIFKQVDREVALSRFKEEIGQPRENEIVIGLPDMGNAEHMIQFASWLAKKDDNPIHLVRPREVPVQTGLDYFRSGLPAYDLEEVDEKQETSSRYTRSLEKLADDLGIEFKFTELITHDAGKGLVNFCGDHNVDLLLLNWRDEFSQSSLQDTHIHYAARRAPCDVAVLKDRGLREVRNVLLATGIGPYDDLEVRVASGIARVHEGSVTLFHVVPPDQEQEQIEEEQAYLTELADASRPDVEMNMKMVKGESVVNEIIEEARGHDLVVMGASGQLFFKQVIFGNVPDMVAQYIDTSVVLVRKKRSARQGVVRSLIDKFVYGTPFSSGPA